MKKCPKCGKTYDDTWKICLHCGVNLSNDLSIKEDNPELQNKGGDKRPNGVTILGVLIIISSVLNLLSVQEGWKFNPLISNYLYLIITPLSIVIAVFLLKLKNWARSAIIAVSIVVLAETFITAPYVLNKVKEYDMSRFDRSFYAGLETGKQHAKPDSSKLTDQQIEEVKQKAMQFTKKVMYSFFVIMIIFSAIFNCIVICYFTRPKVKEQFK